MLVTLESREQLGQNLAPFPAAEYSGEQIAAERAETIIRSAGSLALRGYERPRESSMENLMEAIHEAATGNPEGIKQLSANVFKDVIERTIKTGHVTSTKIDIDKEGQLYQYGQYIDDVYRNALKYASDDEVIMPRSIAETRNGSRIHQAYEDGTLKDNYMLVISLCATGLSDEELEKRNFFARTKSCSLQATTYQNGEIITESAFVAGVKSEGSERHDLETVIKLAAMFGVDYGGKNEAEIIDLPIFIPKHMMENGVIDIVELWDQCAGGTFFGEDKPAVDYKAYLEVCLQRERSYEPQVREIVGRLITEADQIKTPQEAALRLDEVSEEVMLNRACVDKRIDPSVFGRVSAGHIVEARAYMAQGQHEQAMRSQYLARETATSSTCPTALKQEKDTDKLPGEGSPNGESSRETGANSNTGTVRCYKCRETVKKKDVVKQNSWCCPKCNYEVDVCNGKVLNEGSKLMKKPVLAETYDILKPAKAKKNSIVRLSALPGKPYVSGGSA